MTKQRAEPWVSDLRGTKKDIKSSRIIGVGEGTVQVEAGMGNRGVAVWVDDPELARFLATMFERAAELLEQDK